MNIKKLFVVMLIISMLLSCAVYTAVADTESTAANENDKITDSNIPESAILSPGLKNLASRCKLKVSGAAGASIPFSKEDFLRAINLKDIEDITISSLPAPEDGELLYMGNAVKVGQVIDADTVSSLEFIPAASHVTCSEFSFFAEDSLYDVTGMIYVLDSRNTAPTIRDISVGKYVSAYTDVSYKGHLSGYDPDGDEIEYMIVDYPKNGILLLNSKHGEYEYHPRSGFTGKDSFRYVLIDQYGAYSAAETVVISVDSVTDDEKYVDMDDSTAYVEAITLARDGLLGGREVGGKLMFLPKEAMTRGEFISIILRSCDVELNETTLRTVFEDDSDIHPSFKASVAAAYELGYIDPVFENGKMYLRPYDNISVAECASIINRILSIDTDISIPVSSVIEGCPEDAYMAVNSLCSVSILPHSDGVLDASEALTREYAAKIIYNVKTFLNLHQDY